MYVSIRNATVAVLLFVPLLGSAEGPAQADQPSNAPTAAVTAPTAAPEAAKTAEAKPPPWYSTITFSGEAAAYYQVRLDAAQNAPLNDRAFDAPLGFALDQAILSASMAPGPAGFRLDLLFGNTNTVIDAGSAAAAAAAAPSIANHVLQAYAAFKLGPAQLDLGRFVTSAGAEVVPEKDNWLYSRSLLFNLIPFTHTGARLTVPLTDTVTVQGAIVNGWDAVTSPTSGKTGELQVAYSGPNSTTLALTSYFGENQTLWSGALNTAGTWRTLVDAVAGTTVGPIAINVNFDWADEGGDAWWGIAAMARYSLPGDFLRITGRGEYVKDSHGARLGTGQDTDIWEVTAGLSVPMGSNAELRAELRIDKASLAVFTPVSAPSDTQATATLGAVVWF